MNKLRNVLIIAVVAFAVYGTVFSSPNGQSGSADVAESAELSTEPVLHLYTWENYWKTDTEQARREIKMELGVTYETGKLKQITQISQGNDKYTTVCAYNYDDNEFRQNRHSGYLSAVYDGYMHAEHSVRFDDLPSIFVIDDTADTLTADRSIGNTTVSMKDHMILVAPCYSEIHLKEYARTSGNIYENDGYILTTQYLSDVYGNIPQTLKSVKRVIITVNVTVRALDEDRSENPIAEAVVQIRHYEPWEGAELDELLAAGVPLQDTSYRQEMTLIEYTQIEDLGEALS